MGTKSLPCAHIILIVEAKAKAKAKMASMSGVELTDRSKHLYEEIYKGKKHRYLLSVYVYQQEQCNVSTFCTSSS